MARPVVGAVRAAKQDLEANGYSVIPAPSGVKWHLIAVREGSTEPVKCIHIKRTKSALGAKQLTAKYSPPYQASGFQPYRHELWIWIDRKGWIRPDLSAH
jgi:hypothetical protein